MKIKNLIAVAALLLGSTSVSAQLASGGFKLRSVAGTGNPVEITGLADDYTFASDGVVEIPATLPNTAGAAFKVVGVAENAFTKDYLDEDLRLKVKGLKIAASVTSIGANAFADLGNLASVTFGTESEESNLKAIGNGAFAKDPMLKSISFANCPKLLYFTLNGERVMTADEYNATLPGAVHVGDVKTPGTPAVPYADVDEYNTDKGTTLSEEQFNALTDDEKIKTAAVPDVLYTDGDIAEINGINAALDGHLTAPNTYTTPFVMTGATPNTWLTSITLNTGTMDFGLALANVENLTTQNIKDTNIRVLNGGALAGNKKITALELPSKKFFDPETGKELGSYAVEFKANALNNTVIQTLTINGNVVTAYPIPTLGVPNNGTANTLTAVTFNGVIENGGILEGAFAGNSMLKTVTFAGVVKAGAVLGGAFNTAGSAAAAEDGIRMTVTALKAEVNAFDVDAFVADGAAYSAATPLEVKLNTGDDFNIDDYANGIYRVTWTAAPAAPDKIFVECKEGDDTYYAKYHATGQTSISRGKGNVTVYSAYTDGETIYMDPLYSDDDKFIVENGYNVIIKAKGDAVKTDAESGKKYVESEGTGATNTMRYVSGGGTPFDDIRYSAKITNQDLNAAAHTFDPTDKHETYAVAKISKNGLKWQAISNEGTFYVKEAFYLFVKKSATGARVVWLDEENATAIQSFKAKVEAGQIYNLRGEKVNASYKGIVIKDGKKYIQK